MVPLLLLALALAPLPDMRPEPGSQGLGGTVAPPVLHRLPPLDSSKFERFGSAYEGVSEYSDTKNGVFVKIADNTEQDAKRRTGWGYKRSVEKDAESGGQWFVEVNHGPDKVVTVRFRLTVETLRHLIGNQKAPVLARYRALMKIYSVEGFSPKERLSMIEECSRDARSSIRYIAVSQAWSYEPLSDVVPILCRALCDPSGAVAESASQPLRHYFHLAGDKAGKNKQIEVFDFQATPEEFDCWKHSRAMAVARGIHDFRPDLVTEEDLVKIDVFCQSSEGTGKVKQNVKPEAKSEEKAEAKDSKAEPK